MRFITAVFISAALPLVFATDPCTPFGATGTACKFANFTADGTTSNYLNFPTLIVGSASPSNGERSLLPPFEPISSCPDNAVVVAFNTTAKLIQVKIVNDGCVRPIATAMTKIYTADLISHFTDVWGSTPSSPCLARYDWVTGQSTCIQTCSDDSNFVCYVGVNANLTLLERNTADKVSCNSDANLPNATVIPVQPFIQSLAFSTAPTNQLNLVVRTGHYKSRLPPTISIGSSCDPKPSMDWSAGATSNATGVCSDDWSASFSWDDIHSDSCYSAQTDTTRGGLPYHKYDYVVTVVEQDELYIRPGDDVNFATFRTTTTTQSFSLYAKESAQDSLVFDAFDYSNVVSIVTSASMSVDTGSGKLIVKVYNSVQDPFIFKNPTSLALGKSGSENWNPVFDDQSGSQDNGGDKDLLLQFTLTTTAAGCEMDAGSFHFAVQVECNLGTDPSECPIPDDSYENLVVTINVPSVDLCAESSSTDLTAELFVFGSEDYEIRQAFFTTSRDPQDYVYVAAVLRSTQVSIENCFVSVASALMVDSVSKDLLDSGNNGDADWEIVYENKTSSLPSFATGGECVAMYRFTPAHSLFPVPYDSSKSVTLTMTIATEMPTTKRSLSGSAVADTSITLTNPASSDNGDAGSSSSDASHVTASLAMLVAGAAILLF